MRRQPLLHQGRDLARQTQHDPACVPRPGIPARRQDRLKLRIGQRRDHGRGHDPHRHPRLRQPPDRRQPPRGRGHPWLHQPRQRRIQRRHRNADPNQPPSRHLAQNVDVPLDQATLGDNRHRMPRLRQHLQTGAHDAMLLLDRLVGVRVRPDGNRRDPVGLRRQLPPQNLRRLGSRHQFGLEIQPRREPQIGMGRPREAIDAAMLAAPVRVDRPVERQIGRAVVGDQPPRPLLAHPGAQHRQLLLPRPAVIHRLAQMRLEPARVIAQRRPAPDPESCRFVVHGPDWNKSGTCARTPRYPIVQMQKFHDLRENKSVAQRARHVAIRATSGYLL